MSKWLLRTLAAVIALETGALLWAGDKTDPSSPFHHVPITDFMAQKPKKKRWWWKPLEMLGFKEEEPKPDPKPIDKDRQGPRFLPGTGVGSYREAAK